MLYTFKGVGATGKNESGTVDAAGIREARAKLRDDGVYVTEIAEEKKAARSWDIARRFERSIPRKEVAAWLKQVASLVTAGITLMDTLSASQRQSSSPQMQKVVNELRESVRQGEPLADAMAKQEATFDPLTVAMVRAGEAGGRLGPVLVQIAEYEESAHRRREAIRGAMLYPTVVAFISIGVVTFLLAYVVPKITVIFEDLEQALPLSTRILIAVTDTLSRYGFFIGVALCGALLLLARFLKTPKGKRFADRLSIDTWGIGPLVRASILARWSHTTAVLLMSGVRLLETLRLSKDVTQNGMYADAIASAMERIREGEPIAASLEASGLFPPVALQMIAAGEKSGQAPKMLLQMADDQGAELETRIAALMSLVQPVLILAVGLVVGFIVMAILLPIFEISQHI